MEYKEPIKHPLMSCGHLANATYFDGNGVQRPCCSRCAGKKPEAYIVLEKTPEVLEGREATCYCGRTVKSDWNLPFFEYRPDCVTDHYYCGCDGFD